jgi:hypothetical protein
MFRLREELSLIFLETAHCRFLQLFRAGLRPLFLFCEEKMNEQSRFEHNPKVLCAGLRIEPASRLTRQHCQRKLVPAKSGYLKRIGCL